MLNSATTPLSKLSTGCQDQFSHIVPVSDMEPDDDVIPYSVCEEKLLGKREKEKILLKIFSW